MSDQGGYIVYPIEFDRDALAQRAFDHLEENIPNWKVRPNAPDVATIEAVSWAAAELGETASDVPDALMMAVGRLFNILPDEAEEATVDTVFEMKDTLGHTIYADTEVGIPSPSNELVSFVVTEDIVIPPGQSLSGTVTLVASEPGVFANNLGGVDYFAKLITPLTFVKEQGVKLKGFTGGGADAELLVDYLSRLREEFELLSPMPITEADFEAIARNVPGIHRAQARGNYELTTGSTNVENTGTVWVIDELGQDVSTAKKQELLAEYQSKVGVDWVIHVGNPTRTTVDVSFTFTIYEDQGYTPADVKLSAEQALKDYLSPANWGRPDFGDRPLWINENKVRYFEVITVLNNVTGLKYVTDLKLGLNGAAQVSGQDMILPGAAPLPRPGTIIGTAAESV